MSRKHHGSSLDDFLEGEGIFEEAQTRAVKEVVAWQLAQAMQKRSLTKSRLAELLETSRSQVDRLLDPDKDVTLSTLQRAAMLVGRRLRVHLVPSGRTTRRAPGQRPTAASPKGVAR